MPVKVTVTSISGISTIPGDTAPEGDPAWLPSVYNAVAVEFDIKFEYLEDPDTAPILSVNLASISPAVEGLTFTKVGTDTIKVKGTPVNVFPDEIFRFLFDDKSERDLAPTNTEDWKTIIKWAPPGLKEKTVAYNFAVKYDDNPAAAVPIVGATVTATLSQNVAWLFNPSLAYFQDLVKRGKV
jgi:phage terminase large subunit-like protein